MSIKDHAKLANHISTWIRDYAKNAGIKTLILGLSGGIDSALVALLCKQTNLPLLCVSMPCHSSDSAYNRAKKFAREYDLCLTCVDLSKAHDVIFDQAKLVQSQTFGNGEGISNIAVGGLRSCLRAPTLSFFANATRGLIIGTGNRSEDSITRYFQKYGDGCVDISPIADLFKSEVYELFAYLAEQMYIDPASRAPKMSQGAKDIYDAKPTADLWGPDSGQEDEKELGISYDEIEWADREDTRTEVEVDGMGMIPGIIFSEDDPAKRPDFYRYTARQQVVLAKLHQMEKISRHKVNGNLPVCRIRHVEGLVV